MKKTIFPLLVLGLALAGTAFAADEYAVESVTGKVEQELAPGKWQALSGGMILGPATVINTGFNAQLVLSANGRYVIIRAGQKGTVESLAGEVSVSGFRINERAEEAETGVSSGESAGKPGPARDLE